jgi:hypothetical protein
VGVVVAKLLLYIQSILAPYLLPAAASFLFTEAVVFIRVYKEIPGMNIYCMILQAAA